MTAYEEAIQEITAQQKKLDQWDPAFQLGDQLKDILSGMQDAAQIVLQDLKQQGMKLTDCEKKIADFAQKHKRGIAGCCPPKEADRIIREFYGIPAPTVIVGVDLAAGPDFTAEIKPQKHRKVDLRSFM